MIRIVMCRGYYMAMRRYDFYFRVVKTIFYERAQRVSKILFLTRDWDKSHIFHRVMFCLLYSSKQTDCEISCSKAIKLEKVTWSISSIVKIGKFFTVYFQYLTLYYIITTYLLRGHKTHCFPKVSANKCFVI
jgi:hypothetical protein